MVRCDVDILKVIALAQPIYREVYDLSESSSSYIFIYICLNILNCFYWLHSEPSQTKSLDYSPLDRSLDYSPLDRSLDYSPLDRSLDYMPLDRSLDYLPLDRSLDYSPLDRSLDYSPLDHSTGGNPRARGHVGCLSLASASVGWGVLTQLTSISHDWELIATFIDRYQCLHLGNYNLDHELLLDKLQIFFCIIIIITSLKKCG